MTTGEDKTFKRKKIREPMFRRDHIDKMEQPKFLSKKMPVVSNVHACDHQRTSHFGAEAERSYLLRFESYLLTC